MTPHARLLVVDDEELNRELLGRWLERAGYHVDLAENGERALQAIAARPYDVVLLDFMMPGLDGLEVLVQLRRTHSANELPVIMVTAQAESRDVVAALRAGANDYLTKPVDFAVALARIEVRLSLAAGDREMRRSRDLYRLASGAAGECLWDWDVASGQVDYSPQWKAMLGHAPEEICGGPEEWFGRIHPEHRESVRAAIQAYLEGRLLALECQYRIRHKAGHYLWVETRGSLSRDAAGRAVRMAGSQADITERRTVDPETLLPNRLRLEEVLAEAPAGAVLLLAEVDGFARLQGTLPAGGGGRIVSQVAARFAETLRAFPETAGALLARASECQLAIVPEPAAPELARQLAARLQAALERPLTVDGETIFAAATVGIASLDTSAGAALLRDADAAIRRSREQGAARGIAVYEPAIHRRDLDLLHLETDLRQAIEENRMVVYYQPKVNLDTGEIDGAEALVRWPRPGHGLVPPNSFIPLAERTGLIVPLGRQVLIRACLDIVELRRLQPRLAVSVNVSALQLEDPDLPEQVRAALDLSGLEPSGLLLEVTESVLLEDSHSARAMLDRFREMGVGLKLDDFGTGYSSLAYLASLPFDTLKIDRSFVAHLDAGPERVEIVRAILSLANSLHMSVVAEGIENPRQLRILKDLGCHYGQGYWFSPPVPAGSMREMLVAKPHWRDYAETTVS